MNKNRAMLIIAVITFGTVGLFVREINLPSAEIALYRAAIAFLFLTGFMAVTGRFKKLKQEKKALVTFAFSGAVMAVNWMLLFEAYRYTTIALATLVYYAAPTFMVIVSLVVLKERMTAWQLLCFILSTLGLVLMLGVSGGNAGDMRGVLLALFSAVLYTVVVMTNKIAGQTDGILRTYVQFGAAIVVMVPYILLTGGFHLHQLQTRGTISLLILGLFHTGFCYCLYFLSIARLKGQQVAIMSYLDPLVAVLLSVYLLGEHIGFLQITGGVIMVVFALLNELSQQPKPIDSGV
ncbi:MAG: DMT family transporter [Christensenellales bacterium]|jgi:RarD protein|nr:EamA family transporter [Clostridiales bacterium]